MLERAIEAQVGGASSAADPSMLHHRAFAPYKIATLADAAAEHGISVEAVLAGTGLVPDLIRDPHGLTSIADYIRACENMIAAGADLSVAFEVGSRLHLSAYGMYGYALMCSPTVRDFFDFAVRYHLLATPMLRLCWRQDGDLAIWEFVELYHPVMSRSARDFLVRQQLMMTVTHVRDVAGPDVRPIRALVGLPDARNATLDERALGCPCQYDAPRHELHYPLSFLDRAPQFANRLTHRLLEETCNDLLARTPTTSGLSGEIYRLLMTAPHQPLTMESVARLKGMTERTLRRRLELENTRFADIVDLVRKTLALQYVRTTRMTADDIASKLGFSDTSNLRRAVKRWTGSPMGELRRPVRRD